MQDKPVIAWFLWLWGAFWSFNHSVVAAVLEFPVCLRGSHSFLLIRVALMLFFSFLACSWFWEHRFNSSLFFLAFFGQWRSAIFSHSRSAIFSFGYTELCPVLSPSKSLIQSLCFLYLSVSASPYTSPPFQSPTERWRIPVEHSQGAHEIINRIALLFLAALSKLLYTLFQTLCQSSLMRAAWRWVKIFFWH